MGVVFDILMLVMLGATIVYAARLSLQLRSLRDSRADMDKTVRALLTATERAQNAMQGLRLTAQEQGQDLQDVIDKGLSLRDEIQVLSESGQRLAARMEALLDQMRPHAAQMPAMGGRPMAPQPTATPQAPQGKRPEQPHASRTAPSPAVGAVKGQGGMFAIRDPEVERGIDPMVESQMVAQDDAEGLSAAERDLLRALGQSRGR